MAESVEPRKFKVHACIGRGGYGEVYRATMYSAQGPAEVALKVLHPDIDHASQPVQRLRDERRILAAVNHPSILTVHDLVVLEGRIGLVTEWVEGQDLSKCVQPPDRMPVRAVVETIARIADALDYAHHTSVGDGKLGLVHRDVKPANIRVGRNAQVRLLDFGIARAENIRREAKTQADNVFGSFPYMAPERFLSADTQAPGDVFGLGTTLFESLAAERLWIKAIADIYKLVVNETRYQRELQERLDILSDDLDPELVEMLARMVNWDPEKRPTAAEVREQCIAMGERLPGDDLLHWCRDREWPDLRILPGLLSGRVFDEDDIDPLEADNVGRELGWDANDQDITVHIRGFDDDTELRTPPPARRDHAATTEKLVEPPEDNDPDKTTVRLLQPRSRFAQIVRIGLALTFVSAILIGVFFVTFSVMLYLLQRYGG